MIGRLGIDKAAVYVETQLYEFHSISQLKFSNSKWAHPPAVHYPERLFLGDEKFSAQENVVAYIYFRVVNFIVKKCYVYCYVQLRCVLNYYVNGLKL